MRVKSSKPPVILVCLPGSLGHVLALLPMLAELKRAYPTMVLAAAYRKEEWTADQLLLDFDTCIELTDWGHAAKLRHSQVSRHTVDVIVDASEDHRCAWLGWIAGVRKRLGVAANSWSLRSQLYTDLTTSQTVETSGDEFLRLLGVESNHDLLPIGPHARVVESVQRLLEECHLTGSFIAVHADENPQDEWTADRLGRVSKQLGERYQIPSLVVWHGDLGRVAANRAVASSGGHALMCPPRSLSDLAGIIGRSEAVLSAADQLHRAAWVAGTPSIHPGRDSQVRNGSEDQIERLADVCAARCTDKPTRVERRKQSWHQSLRVA